MPCYRFAFGAVVARTTLALAMGAVVARPVSALAGALLAVGTDAPPNPSIESEVRVLEDSNDDGKFDELRSVIQPFGQYQGGVRVALGDVDSDGLPDLVASTCEDEVARTAVFSLGVIYTQQVSLMPFGNTYRGMTSVAVGTLGYATPDCIVVGSGAGGGLVAIFRGDTGERVASFYAFDPNFRGGVNVAAGDMNGDGFDEIIVGMAAGGPQVKVFDGSSGVQTASFLAFPGLTRTSSPSARSGKFLAPASDGVSVAAGDVNGDGMADIIVGAGPGGGPHVKVFSGREYTLERYFDAFPGFTGGVYVAAGDVNGDTIADIVVSQGAGGGGIVRVFDGRTQALSQQLTPFGAQATGAVWCGVWDRSRATTAPDQD